MSSVEFLGDCRTTFPEDAVEFRALVDGKPVRCFISREALQQHCGATDQTPGAAEAAFKANQQAIQDVATNLIDRGRVSPPGELWIRAADIPRARQ
jgi:hypothetical protein